MSDIIDNPLGYIASGPTVLQRLDTNHILSIISKYENQLSKVSPDLLEKLVQSQGNITQQSTQIDVNNVLVGSIEVAVQSAADTARQLGYDTHVWSADVHGEATAIADMYADICKILVRTIQSNARNFSEDIEQMRGLIMPLTSPLSFSKLQATITHISSSKLCLISGGEPTVTVRGNGRGGRNQELALAFAKAVHELPTGKIMFTSVGTDGQDGPTDAAGAIVDDQTWGVALDQGLNPQAALENNDSYGLLSNLGNGENLVKIGLTGTNVMDIHILLIEM